MTIHTRLHMRTGDEIREAWAKPVALWSNGFISYEQMKWATTFLTLPPNESDMEARIAA